MSYRVGVDLGATLTAAAAVSVVASISYHWVPDLLSYLRWSS